MPFGFTLKSLALRFGLSLYRTVQPSSETEERLKRVSIRGRVAFGITCLEQALTHYNLRYAPQAEHLLAKLWSFVSSSDLSEWEEDVQIYLALDEIADKAEKSAQTNEAADLRKWWATLSAAVQLSIEHVIETGRGNLYGATVGYSAGTLETTMQVVAIMQSSGIPLPQLAPFEKSQFEERHGWGDRVDRSFFAES